ncbi:inosine guanosine and xanthosine phosphorylase family [Oceaniovalibus guishaninsula JLT2003]|uniref:Purine nucleoside phosphorylase n=1 Tax=Oceaniovalibus guishaninsula JLT2003 TaxID=1231392 RepID=K2H6H2_9RHOB|nr:purine-nucleoside phosphorylase [Oceaniovalibus guishaninsula]EKE43208.1 inosine guanosine and xanthosine phosphorylase family [Oceaniovalibus guishaninsula JLT2003]
MRPDFPRRLQRATDSIRARTDARPVLGLVAGTGLAPFLNEIETAARIPYGEIADFPVSTAPGHAGELLLGHLRGRPVAGLSGRLHAYEGWHPDDIVLPVYVLRALGCETLVVTNAAGGLNPAFPVPALMAIADHINLTGLNPLAGPNDPALGLRFPDLSRAYDPDLLRAVQGAARALGIDLRTGVYAGCHGPALETSAERRFMRLVGGDAVGMSTVLEVVAANHAGMRVLGLSAIANAATGGPDQQPDTVEQIVAATEAIAGTIGTLIARMLDSGDL